MKALSGKQQTIEHRYRRRDHFWRVQSDDRGLFDEIVVRKGRAPRKGNGKGAHGGLILHAEMMDDRSCFIDVAGLCLWVHVGRDGVARITHQEDRRV